MEEWTKDMFKRIARGQQDTMFKKSLTLANEIYSIPEMILFLHKEIKEFKQSGRDFNLVGGFVYKIKAEIEYLELLSHNQQAIAGEPPFKRLPITLTNDQANDLFDLLVKGGYIPNTTDKDCFKWVFSDHIQSRPDKWKAITWNEAKQGLRELLTPLLGTITAQHIRDIEQLFLKDGIPFKMSKPKNGEHSARCTDIEKIVNSLNLEKIPTNTDQL